ncbi:MAG: DedA family protein [bacterium]|nr:DedA family protein [bacterium]
MQEYVHEFIKYLDGQSSPVIIYLALFLSAIVENLFPPIPGDTITAFGAFLVGAGKLNYALVYLCTTLGSVLGFMGLYYLGGYLGREYFMKKNFRFFPKESIIAAEEKFAKFGYYVVLINRFLPGVRSVISLVSGISELKALRVFILALLSAGVWNFIWIHAGYLMGDNWEDALKEIDSIMAKYNLIVGIILGVLFAAYVGFKIRKKIQEKKAAKENNNENPEPPSS